MLLDNFRWTSSREGLFARVKFRLDVHQGRCQRGLMLHSTPLRSWKNYAHRHWKVQCDSHLSQNSEQYIQKVKKILKACLFKCPNLINQICHTNTNLTQVSMLSTLGNIDFRLAMDCSITHPRLYDTNHTSGRCFPINVQSFWSKTRKWCITVKKDGPRN